MAMTRVRSGDRQPDSLDTPFLDDCEMELTGVHGDEARTSDDSVCEMELTGVHGDEERTSDDSVRTVDAGAAGAYGDAGTEDVGAKATGAGGDAGITDDSAKATGAEEDAGLHGGNANATGADGDAGITDGSAKGAGDATSPLGTATLPDETQQFGETYVGLELGAFETAEIKHTSVDQFARIAGAALTAVADSAVQRATASKESEEALTEAAIAASRPNRTSGGVCAQGSVLDIIQLGTGDDHTPHCLKCASVVDPFKAIIKSKRKESTSYICRPCNSISTMTTRTVGTLPEMAQMSISETNDFFTQAAETADSSGRFSWGRIRGILISTLTRTVQRVESAKMHGEYLPLSVWKARGFDTVAIASGGDRMEHPVLGEVFRIKLLSTTSERIETTIRESVLKAEAALKGTKKRQADSSAGGNGSVAGSSADQLPADDPLGAFMIESSDEEPLPKRTRVQGAAAGDVESRMASLAASSEQIAVALQQFSAVAGASPAAGVGSPGTPASGTSRGSSPGSAAGGRGGRKKTVDPAVAAAAEQQKLARQLAKSQAAEARQQQQLQKAAAREITKNNAKVINLAQRTTTSLGHLAATAEQSLRLTKGLGIPEQLKTDLEKSKTEAKRMLKVAQNRLTQSAKATATNVQLDGLGWVAEDVTALIKKLKDSKM